MGDHDFPILITARYHQNQSTDFGVPEGNDLKDAHALPTVLTFKSYTDT